MPKEIERTIQLTPVQNDFFECDAIFRGFTGGRGAGKSFLGSLDMIVRAMAAPAGSTYMIVAPTYGVLQDTSFKSFMDHVQRFGIDCRINTQQFIAKLPEGKTILFRSAERPGRLRGKNLSGIWMDEAGEVEKEVYDIVIACLREGGRQGWLSATFTPKGRTHWTYEVFGKKNEDGTEKKNTKLFRSPTLDNVFLPPDFEQVIRSQYTSRRAEQELQGLFVDMTAGVFERGWFKKVEKIGPIGARRIRSWDKAGTDEGGCFTVGVLMAYDPMAGVFYVEDLVRGQWSAFRRNNEILRTAKEDAERFGNVEILIEQEPGSGGKESAEFSAKQLVGYKVHLERPSGDKIERAQPFAAQAESGNVFVKNAIWTEEYLDELASFPDSKFSDQVDASSAAFNRLALHAKRKFQIFS